MRQWLWNTGPEGAELVSRMAEETHLPLEVMPWPAPACDVNYLAYDEGAALLAGLVSVYASRELTELEMKRATKWWVGGKV